MLEHDLRALPLAEHVPDRLAERLRAVEPRLPLRRVPRRRDAPVREPLAVDVALGAERLAVLALLVAAHDRDRAAAGVHDELDRERPEPAGAAPHQDDVAGLHGVRRPAEQHPVRRGAGQRGRRRLLPREVLGLRQALMRLDLGELRERPPARVVAPDAERVREPRVAAGRAPWDRPRPTGRRARRRGRPPCTFVTSEPTAYTMPLASEPTMWKSVGSPHRACVFVTSTGIPLAAQTLLKFTPPAMTITSASSGPSSGTSITSSWIACSGSPNRSGRTTLRVHLRRDLADRRQLADLVQLLAHGYHPSRSDGPGNPSKGGSGRATGRGGRASRRARGRRRGMASGRRRSPSPVNPAGPAAAVLRRGRNDAFMSSRLNAPEASPVVAYRYSAALNTPEHAAPIAMQRADRDDQQRRCPRPGSPR